MESRDLTEEECYQILFKHSKGKTSEQIRNPYWVDRSLHLLTPLGEVVLQGRNSRDVYLERVVT